jgi:hypothetical protein
VPVSGLNALPWRAWWCRCKVKRRWVRRREAGLVGGTGLLGWTVGGVSLVSPGDPPGVATLSGGGVPDAGWDR